MMPPDCFALLEEPRRPWIDLDALQTTFHRLSAAAHPDRVHGAGPAAREEADRRSATLNAAYQCLREPKDRLLHLLELERGGKPAGIQSVPADLMDLFMQVGQLSADVNRFLAGKEAVTSPLLKVQQFEQALEWTDRLQTLLGSLGSRRAALHEKLQGMNSAWTTAAPPGHPDRAAQLPLDELEQIYRTLSYLNRWANQLQDHVVHLAFPV